MHRDCYLNTPQQQALAGMGKHGGAWRPELVQHSNTACPMPDRGLRPYLCTNTRKNVLPVSKFMHLGTVLLVFSISSAAFTAWRLAHCATMARFLPGAGSLMVRQVLSPYNVVGGSSRFRISGYSAICAAVSAGACVAGEGIQGGQSIKFNSRPHTYYAPTGGWHWHRCTVL